MGELFHMLITGFTLIVVTGKMGAKTTMGCLLGTRRFGLGVGDRHLLLDETGGLRVGIKLLGQDQNTVFHYDKDHIHRFILLRKEICLGRNNHRFD